MLELDKVSLVVANLLGVLEKLADIVAFIVELRVSVRLFELDGVSLIVANLLAVIDKLLDSVAFTVKL